MKAFTNSLDLGIATSISSDGQAHQMKAFGSAHYVAPEQARGSAIDGRADIYALRQRLGIWPPGTNV